MRRFYQSDEFTRQLADLERHVGRMSEFIRGLKQKLLANPEFGTKVRENPPVWFVAMPDIVPEPLAVAYTFDDERIVLLSIWISEGDSVID